MSSGRPPAAIAVIRISGPGAIAAATIMAGSLPLPRRATLRALRDGGGELLDRGLVLVFPGPESATGEDLVEFHCHGGRAVVEAVERALCAQTGVRRAEPGEFTRRSLLNGRIDLTEAEGLADLLEAETDMQRRTALAAAEGRVSQAVRGWMDRLAVLSARVEGAIDYAEEGDAAIEAESMADVAAGQRMLAEEIQAVLTAPPVERWRDGFRVVVAGPPNAGKSTLVNLLSERDVAIVSPIAGTTRDRIEVAVRRRGVGYVLIDTAGLHGASDDVIERAGMDRAREAMATADLVLWMGDGAPRNVDRWLRVDGRADLRRSDQPGGGASLPTSTNDPASIERLWEMIEQHGAVADPGIIPLHEREWALCREASTSIMRPDQDPLIQAEQLRDARRRLAEILGREATALMLNALFSRFCVGK